MGITADGYYAGLMSGTSMDAIDACLIEIRDNHPQRLVAWHAQAIPAKLQTALHDLVAPSWQGSLAVIAELDQAFGRLQATALHRLLEKAGLGSSAVRAVGCHGQTIAHAPTGKTPYSWQLGDPTQVAEATGITTVSDFRRRDLAAGGQGAPLVPAFHRRILPDDEHDQVVLNIGGIANITLWFGTTATVLGFDTGPGNTLMDAWSRHCRGDPYDRDGAWAASGSCDADLLARCLADSYFDQPPPKSTGREHFHLQWLTSLLPDQFALQDVQATLCELSARTIADAIRQYAPTARNIWVCGGGWHNKQLIKRLQANLANRTWRDTAELGFPADWVEAAAFAWLAQRALTGQAGNEPEVTGASRRTVLGAIYPGRLTEARSA